MRIFIKSISAFKFPLVGILAVLISVADGSPANAADEAVHIGHSTSVVKDVQGESPGRAAGPIATSDKIYFNENIITSGDSSIVIQFRDGSTFELGPDGAMTIDDMVFNPFESESEKVVNLIQGTFRYISGYTAASAAVTINTPVGTIGIRGSNNSGIVIPDGNGGATVVNTISSGTATLTNNAGTETLETGQSSAITGPDTDIMSGDEMPDALAAEAMNYIEESLGATGQAVSQNLDPTQQAANAAANAVPVGQQATQTAAGQSIDPDDLPPFDGPALIQQAAEAGALTADAINDPTPEQQAALEAVAANNPDAAATVESFTEAGAQANAANVNVGTQDVVTGTSANVTDVEQIAALVQATVAANPDVTEITANAAVTGGSQNEAVGDIADVAQQVGEGVVAGATDAGVDVVAAVQSAGEGVVAGASAAGLDVGAAAQGATQGAITGAVATGADVSDVTQAITAGAITAAVESGADVTAVSQSITAAAINTAESLNLDTAAVTTAVVSGATSAAEDTGADIDAIVDSISETVTDTVTDDSTPSDDPASTTDDEAPEVESEQQNNASDT